MNVRIRLAFHLEPPIGLNFESDTAPHRIDPLDVTIALEKPDDDSVPHSILLVERSVEAPAGTEHVLADIFAGRIPNVGATYQWVGALVASGLTAEEAIKAKPGDPFATTVLFEPDTLPNQLRDLVLNTTAKLTEIARIVIRSWRYHMGKTYPLNLTRIRNNSKWSLNGTDWLPLPQKGFNVTVRARAVVTTQDEIDAAWLRIENHTDSEPLAFDLLGEARLVAGYSPRSALVIGCAAAEVGVKQFLATRAPTLEWLIMNAPSPPIPALLVHNVTPLRPTDAPELPKALRKGITEIIEKRNELVHKGSSNITPNEANDHLDAVEDLLRLLDLYDGRTWGLEYLTQPTRNALQWPPATPAPTA